MHSDIELPLNIIVSYNTDIIVTLPKIEDGHTE